MSRPPVHCHVPHFFLGLVVATVLLVALAQLELVSKTTKRLEHTFEETLDHLDLDEPVDFTGTHALRASQEGAYQQQRAQEQHRQPQAAASATPEPEGGAATMAAAAEKVGAGLLFVSEGGLVLLLKRRSKHNDSTWSLPGGNQDPEDQGDLLATAKREAVEEMGLMPAGFAVKGSFLTRRGKRLQKHYTVFVARITAEAQKSFSPQLDPKEHSAWQWFKLKALVDRAAVASAQDQPVSGGAPELDGVELHPVVALAVGQQHRQQLLSMANGQAQQQQR